MVGNFVSEAALAAVSICSPITNLLVGFFNGMSLGNTVVVARAFGQDDETELRYAIRYAFTFSVVMGILVSLCSVLLAPVLLRITGANEEIYREAIVYLRIYIIGVMFMVIYNCGTGILRATGDSRTPLHILAASSLINIILDLVFVGAIGLGTAGVGIATILAQGVSVIFIYRSIRSRAGSHCIDFKHTFREGMSTVLSSLNIGFAAGLQGALISFSNIFVWSYINRFPTSVAAGIGAANKIDRFVVLPCKAIGMTTATFVSQNIGAKNFRRARQGIWYSLTLGMAVTGALCILLYFFAESCIRLFSRESAVIIAGAGMSRFLVFFYWMMVVRESLTGYLRGYGRSKMPMLLSLVGMVGCRQLFLAWASGISDSIRVIYACYPIGWGSAMFFLILYTLFSIRRIWNETEYLS